MDTSSFESVPVITSVRPLKNITPPRCRIGRRIDSSVRPLQSLKQALADSVTMACGICWEPADQDWTCPSTRNIFCSPCMAEYILTTARHNQRTSRPSMPCPETGCTYSLTTEGGLLSRVVAMPQSRSKGPQQLCCIILVNMLVCRCDERSRRITVATRPITGSRHLHTLP